MRLASFVPRPGRRARFRGDCIGADRDAATPICQMPLDSLPRGIGWRGWGPGALSSGKGGSGLGAGKDRNRLGAGGDLELVEDLLHVIVDRAAGTAEDDCDLAVGLAPRNPAQDFKLML